MVYQGTLTNQQGFPASDPVDLTFRFFDAAMEGERLPVDDTWEEVHPAVPVNNGRFSVLLGSRTEGGLPDALFDNRAQLWLEITVGEETLPRTRMTSTAFAREAQSVVDGAIGTEALQGGAVTEGKIATNAVTSAHLAPGAVQSNDLAPDAVTENKVDDGAISVSKLSPPVPDDESGNRVLTYLAAIDEMSWENPGFFGSSIRWKENVRTLDDALAVVEQLRGVRYDWKESGEADVGVIAEEVAAVLPELVAFEEDGQARGVHYAKMVAVLIEATKAQQTELEAKTRTITQQRDELQRQQSEIDTLNDRLDRLERLVEQQMTDASTEGGHAANSESR